MPKVLNSTLKTAPSLDVLLHFSIVALLAFVFSANTLSSTIAGDIRKPYVAGSFYPSDKDQLSSLIDNILHKTPNIPRPEGEIIGLILPHAGYEYSGPTAAYGYKMIQGLPIDTVIILGPYHKANFSGASIWNSGSWLTPLGEVPVDSELANAIIREDKSFSYSRDLHLTEHSIEVELPFLQKVLKNFKIVPILVSTPSIQEAQNLAKAILKNIQGRNVLIIASTDMSHYYPKTKANKMDSLSLALMQKGETDRLLEQSRLGNAELCGIEAVATLLELSKLVGSNSVHLLNYATSADTAGNPESVVGYGDLLITKDPLESKERNLNPNEKKELLRIARITLEAFVNKQRVPEFKESDPALMKNKAVFVTLRNKGILRGCIGRLEPQEPLYLAVKNMTIEAASKDSRFTPVRPDELKDIQIGISILTPPHPIANADEIIMGKHGVIAEKNEHSGVFLPSVAKETGWSKEKFLKELCTQKAELPENCWKDPKTSLYIFTSDDFEE